ncbi:hypothetical protein AOC06_01650 [Polynucleobacter paludilacus]|uniref:hypothetical protein n=1 Tax=Polynucleobacter paludilacus TaxID=1855895 RepID=UPI001BFD4E3B|nr:hypothetical protein [Polynucleobacter paludilacus]QWD87312.1 hypothetical protein AOC06_01650 [Polynucleobacter paludilacus]
MGTNIMPHEELIKFNALNSDLPFPVVNGMLSASTAEINALIEIINAEIIYSKDESYSGGRVDIPYGSEMYKRVYQKSLLLKRIQSELSKAEYWNKSAEKLNVDSTDISDHFPLEQASIRLRRNYQSLLIRLNGKMRRKGISLEIPMRLFKPKYEITINIGYALSGYYVPPHQDNRNKLIVGLIYLGGSENQNLLLCKTAERDKYPRILQNGDYEIFKRVQQMKGVAVMFVNQHNAYHATEQYKQKEPKVFIYYSLAQKYVEHVFTKDEVKLRDEWIE